MPKLTIVPTPIGNIDDITIRAKKVLEKAEIILCEDTRVTLKLLKLLNIDTKDKKLLPYFEHNEREKISSAINLLNSGYDLVLVSDAGTPLLSDPGFPLVREIRQNYSEIQIEVLPGATSITTALVLSGFPTDKFMFLGYMPRKSGEIKKLIQSSLVTNQSIKTTFIAFENPKRIESTLKIINGVLGENIDMALVIEISKRFEKFFRGSPLQILEQISNGTINLKGELVICFNLNT